MALESVQLVPPSAIEPNPENPRLIFHQDELDALQESIKKQGILVPLTVYRDGSRYRILDGERRWRCAVKLGMPSVPVIVQPKPAPLQNLMMMFAIHHRRNEWDPLPTAMKLQTLEELYERVHGARPTEKQLAELASLKRGEVRRYKKLLALPQEYKDLLLDELYKPRSEQRLSVDHVLEATAAATALHKRGLIDDVEPVRRAIVEKFLSGVITSTVDPRLLARVARAVDREELGVNEAKEEILRFIKSKSLTIRELYEETVADAEFYHAVDLLTDRLAEKLQTIDRRRRLPDDLRESLAVLERCIRDLLK